MAERRMFTKKVTDSDAFIELSSPAQALYFHLNQGADDDGFNNQIQNAMFKAHASIDDLKVLLMKNFIIKFESGVIVIKHWRMHNTLRKDRYTPTNFQEELKGLGILDNGIYTLNDGGCHLVAKRLPQDRIGKVSIGKNNNSTTPTNAHAREEQKNTGELEEEPLLEEPLVDDLFTFLENAWGRTLSSFEYELLSNWKDDEITRYAIKESVKCNARSIKYVERIVENLKAKGIKTEAEAIIESDNFKSKRNKKTNSTQRETLADKLKRLKEEAKIHDEVEARR